MADYENTIIFSFIYGKALQTAIQSVIKKILLQRADRALRQQEIQQDGFVLPLPRQVTVSFPSKRAKFDACLEMALNFIDEKKIDKSLRHMLRLSKLLCHPCRLLNHVYRRNLFHDADFVESVYDVYSRTSARCPFGCCHR